MRRWNENPPCRPLWSRSVDSVIGLYRAKSDTITANIEIIRLNEEIVLHTACRYAYLCYVPRKQFAYDGFQPKLLPDSLT